MANNQQPAPKQSRASDFMRSAGIVHDPDHKLWGPTRWIAQMIQYLVALVMITVAEGFKAVVSGEKPRRGRPKPRTE